MSLKEVNKFIINNKHEEAYKILLEIKPSFQVMITKSAGEDKDASAGVKQLSEEMKKTGIEEMAVFIYEGSTPFSENEPISYPDVVDTQLEKSVVFIIADVDTFKTDDLLSSYYQAVKELGSSDLIFQFPDDVKGLVTDFILFNTEYDLDNSILVLRSNTMEFHLRNDKTYFKEVHKQIYDTIYIDRDYYGNEKQIIHGKTLEQIFTDLMNLPSEKYNHILKTHEYESNQDPVYYSDTWMKIANEVDKISGSLFQIGEIVKPLKDNEPYRHISDASVLKRRFFSEAIYRNMIFIHLDFLPKANEPTNLKQKMFYDICKLVYQSSSGFIIDTINPYDIAHVAEMKKDYEEKSKQIDILSIPPDAGMEYV